MRKSRFTDEQIVAIVRESEAEGMTVEQVSKKHGITPTTLFRWRKRFSRFDASQASELRRFQQENARLKEMVAERDLAVHSCELAAADCGSHTPKPSEVSSSNVGTMGPHPQLRTVN